VIAKIAISLLQFASPRQWVINLIELISNPDGIERQVLNAIDTERSESFDVRKRALSTLLDFHSKQPSIDEKLSDVRIVEIIWNLKGLSNRWGQKLRSTFTLLNPNRLFRPRFMTQIEESHTESFLLSLASNSAIRVMAFLSSFVKQKEIRNSNSSLIHSELNV